MVDSPELSGRPDTPLIPARYHPLWIDFAVIEAYKDSDNSSARRRCAPTSRMRVQDLILRYEVPQPPALRIRRPSGCSRGRLSWPPRPTPPAIGPYAFGDFSGGLNLRDKADTVGDREAIDLLNVTFTERGAMRQRDGYADFTPSRPAAARRQPAAFYTVAGLRQLIAGCGTRLDALDTAGAIVASRTGMGGGPWAFARFGDPLHEYLYAANGTNPLQRWDGAAWADGAALAERQRHPRAVDAARRLDHCHRARRGHHVRHERREPARRDRVRRRRPTPGRAAPSRSPSRVLLLQPGAAGEYGRPTGTSARRQCPSRRAGRNFSRPHPR